MDVEKDYENLSVEQKKELDWYDQRISKVMDKTPEYFFKARQEGGEIYDSDILELLKKITFDKMINDPVNHSHVLTEVSNKICRLYENWLDAEIKLSLKK